MVNLLVFCLSTVHSVIVRSGWAAHVFEGVLYSLAHRPLLFGVAVALLFIVRIGSRL